MIKHALHLASLGFRVFPCVPGGKTPVIDDFPARATTDSAMIEAFWRDPVLGIIQPYNVAISTDDIPTLDIDVKKGKNGEASLAALELQYGALPATCEQRTPSGGRHIFFHALHPIANSAGKLGEGLDVRGKGGFVVGAGSVFNGGTYTMVERPIQDMPQWLLDLLPRAKEQAASPESTDIARIYPDRALDRSLKYLDSLPPVHEGQRNGVAFATACRLKEFGLSETAIVPLLIARWKAEPMLEWEELEQVVHSAFSPKRSPQGCAAPEVQFQPTPAQPAASVHPVLALNQEFALLQTGGGVHVLRELIDAFGRPKTEHIAVEAFHTLLAPRKLQTSESKVVPVSRLWISHPSRRTYDGVVFSPGRPVDSRFYNLWRGFTAEPLAPGEACSQQGQDAVAMWYEHARENICGGKPELFHWLVGYAAQLVQQPWAKPRTAIVLQGLKGVGKNAWIDRIGHLLGVHYQVTSNRRYLFSNFNSHMENCLLMFLDEAVWGGDKQTEGTLKDLITGNTHIIERKGQEPYTVANLTRVVIAGNERWLVPATHDERRYAVFYVAPARQKDKAWFRAMRKGLDDADGGRLLLRQLLDFDLSTVDVNEAPCTKGLAEQKEATLAPIEQWWLDSLTEGRLACSDFAEGWPAEPLERERVRAAFRRHSREHNVNSRSPCDSVFGRTLQECCRSVLPSRIKGTTWAYTFPSLNQARRDWETYIGHKVRWEDE